MTDITNTALFKAASTVQSSITQPLPAQQPTFDNALKLLEAACRFQGQHNNYNLGKLYGKNISMESLFNAIFEGLKMSQDDPLIKDKIAHMQKAVQSLWHFFVASHGKQLTELELLSILSGYIIPSYEKQKEQSSAII